MLLLSQGPRCVRLSVDEYKPSNNFSLCGLKLKLSRSQALKISSLTRSLPRSHASPPDSNTSMFQRFNSQTSAMANKRSGDSFFVFHKRSRFSSLSMPSTPSDSPTDPFGLEFRSRKLPLQLPVTPSFAKHLPLRMQLLRDTQLTRLKI